MNTLIVYRSKHGTTGKCAAILSEKFPGTVDVYDLKLAVAPDLTKYDRVVIGGSIYAGRIQKEIKEFCTQNLNLLMNKKLGLFICCMFPNHAEMQLKNSFPQELLSNAAAKESFGGEMRFSDMNFAEKAITKMVSKAASKNDPTLSVMDMKSDVSMISMENIDRFVQRLNNF